jgi:hypothetical protein
MVFVAGLETTKYGSLLMSGMQGHSARCDIHLICLVAKSAAIHSRSVDERVVLLEVQSNGWSLKVTRVPVPDLASGSEA